VTGNGFGAIRGTSPGRFRSDASQLSGGNAIRQNFGDG
jgi:hypothetical protein